MNYCWMIAIHLSRRQVPDADPKGIQQINFTANLDREGHTAICILLLKKQKKPF